jgi:hypothetical protein
MVMSKPKTVTVYRVESYYGARPPKLFTATAKYTPKGFRILEGALDPTNKNYFPEGEAFETAELAYLDFEGRQIRHLEIYDEIAKTARRNIEWARERRTNEWAN